MHGIDYFINIKGYNKGYYSENLESDMLSLNPVGFTYGYTKDTEYLVYNESENTRKYFIDSYAKTNYMKDRAVTFSDMISRVYAATYYQVDTPFNTKAKFIANQIDEYFECVNDYTVETWEKWIK